MILKLDKICSMITDNTTISANMTAHRNLKDNSIKAIIFFIFLFLIYILIDQLSFDNYEYNIPYHL